MKKKIIAVALAVCMTLSLIPFSLAEETETAEPTTQEKVEAVMETVSDSLDNGQSEEAQEALNDALDTSTDTDPTLTEEEQETPLSDVVGEDKAGQVEEILDGQEETPAEEQPAEEESDLTVGETIEEMEEAIEEEPEIAEEVAEILTEEVPFDVEAACQYLLSLQTEEDMEYYLETLTEDQRAALEQYAEEHPLTLPEEERTAQTKVMTDSAPFLDPVDVSKTQIVMGFLMSAPLMAAVQTPQQEEGIVKNPYIFTKKEKAEGTETNTYQITIDAFTTGRVEVVEKSTPVDVVLVLDQSGSMAYDFEGNSTSYANSRQKALKDALSSFIGKVAEKYKDSSDHRISIVTFTDEASVKCNLTKVDSEGVATLQGIVSALPQSPSGGTQPQHGLAEANAILSTGYTYNGSNTTRNKVVILFTDGVPGNQGFDTNVATSAIAEAKALKDEQVSVYSVSIFQGADPDNYFGNAEYFASQGLDVSDIGDVSTWSICDVWKQSETGAVGEKWLIHSGITASSEIQVQERTAGNRFMNFVSSNFPSAEEIGINGITEQHGRYMYIWPAEFSGYEVTRTYNRVNFGYYLTADDSASLSKIFESISQHIATSNIEMGTEAELRDYVTQYFDPPESYEDVSVSVVPCIDYTGDPNEEVEYESCVWGTPVPASEYGGITMTVEDREIIVKGFDYDANYVTTKEKRYAGSKDFGEKIQVTFTVTVRDGFWGGDQVPTNEAKSGLVNSEGQTVENLDVPKVDIPINDQLITTDQYVKLYCGTNMTEDVLAKALVKWDGADDFVTIEFPDFYLKSGELRIGTAQDDRYESFEVDVYKGKGTEKAATPAVEKEINIQTCVYKPNLAVTSVDLFGESGKECNLKDALVLDTALLNATWTHDRPIPDLTKKIDGTPVPFPTEDPILGDPPAITVSSVAFAWSNGTEVTGETYTPDGLSLADDFNVTKITCDVGVLKGLDLLEYNAEQEDRLDGTFVVTNTNKDPTHDFTVIVTVTARGDLTIVKNGLNESESAVIEIWNAQETQRILTIDLTGSESEGAHTATVCGLPVGTYVVKEATDWSYKYTADAPDQVAMITENGEVTVTFNNTYDGSHYRNTEACRKEGMKPA